MDKSLWNDQLAHIQSREDFTEYGRMLLSRFRLHPATWENMTLDAFLEALISWVEDMEGFYANRGERLPEAPSWKMFAEALTATTVYE
jgi:hypothetical protein